MLDDWRGSEYACVQTASNNVLCHHCKHLMGYFEFLYGSDMIFLLLIIPEKLHRQYLVKKPEEAETDVLFLVNTIQYPRTLKNNIHYSNKPVPPPFFYSDTNPVFGHVRSNPFVWQKPCSGCNSGIYLVFALEYTFLQLCSNVGQRFARFRRS